MATRGNNTYVVDQDIFLTLTNNVLAVEQSLYALVGLRIYSELAPPNAKYPCIVFKFGGGNNLRGNFASNIVNKPRYTIEAITQDTDFNIVNQIQRLVDQLIPTTGTNRQVTLDGQMWVIYVGDCQVPTKAIDIDDRTNIRYNRMGGIYEWFSYPLTDADSALGNTYITGAPLPTIAQTLQTEVDALTVNLGALQHMFSLFQPTGIEPEIQVTAASVSPTLPLTNTVYRVKPVANQVILLPVNTGTDVVMHFDLTGLGAFTTSFTLNGSDLYADTSANSLLVAASIANALAGGVAAITLRAIANGVWALE